MAALRAPNGCPWDREQTHQSLAEYLIEETSELLDTIDHGDMDHMREELGDVLLQVVFHAQIASENGHFNFDDVAAEINEKLVRRHPHVFGDHDKLDNSEQVLVTWNAVKATEKKNGTPSKSCIPLPPNRLPALLFSKNVYKQLKKHELLTKAGLDDTFCEQVDQLDEKTLGELLFKITARCKDKGLDPEALLRTYVDSLIEKVDNA